MQGWFMPAEAAVQFQQCVIQQVRPEVLAPMPDERKKRKITGEAAASLLQLPGVDDDVVRSLEKPHKIKSLVVRACVQGHACMAAVCGSARHECVCACRIWRRGLWASVWSC
jgi:hypothetical protein